MEWNPVPRYFANGKILGYTIYFKENGLDRMPFQRVNASGHNTTQFTLKGLKRAHEYLVAVAAFTSEGEGPLSDNVYATTGMCKCSLFLACPIFSVSSAAKLIESLEKASLFLNKGMKIQY